jgi:hypothetical protein
MANWTAENPGEIDSGALATTATTLQTTETSLTEARDTAVTAQGGISDAIWTGEAATAWVNSLSTPIGKINAVVPEMTAVRTAIATYTTTVEDIKTRATSYKETIVQATLLATVQYMDAIGGPDPAQQALRDEQHQTALNDKATAERLLEGLTVDRETADAALVSALSSPGGDNWDAQQAALAAIGITSAAGLSPSSIAKGMAELAAELGHGTFDADAAAQLQSLYALYGNDASVMAQMNLALGGEDLISLINRIDEAGANEWMAPGAALLLAQSVRGGLSVGSQRWTDAVGQNFAQELYDGSAAVHGTDSWTSLAFLFGDEQDNPIGETTTVGLADIADEMERGNPGANAGLYGPGQGVMGPDGFLALAEAEQAGYDVNRLGDWTSRVFSTLGEYPEAALDWLTDSGSDPYQDSPQYTDRAGFSDPYGENSTLGQNRVDYWYGRRDSHLDGFEGVLALWEGAQSIPGGPTDSTFYSEDAWEKTALLSHDVIYELIGEPRENTGESEFRPGNPYFSSDTISELGSVKLTEALAPQLPGLVEKPILDPTGLAPSQANPVRSLAAFGIEGEERPYSWLSQDSLARIMGIAGSQEGGAAALQAVVENYQEVVLGASEMGAYSPVDAITRVNFMQAALDGSTAGVDLGAATRHDEAVASAIGVVETGVGMLPIPGLDKLVGSLGDEIAKKIAEEGAGYIRGQATDAVTGAATEAFGQTHEQLATALGDGKEGRAELAKIQAAQMIVALGLVPDLELPDTDDPVELSLWVENHSPQLNDALNPADGSTQTVGGLGGDYWRIFDSFEKSADD